VRGGGSWLQCWKGVASTYSCFPREQRRPKESWGQRRCEKPRCGGGPGAAAPQDDDGDGGAAAGGDGCVPAVRSASVAEGDRDRGVAAASLRDVEGARRGPGDGSTVRKGLERRAIERIL
jgi:hypothetical protein